MMNAKAFKIYVKQMLELGLTLGFKDSAGNDLGACTTDAHSISVAVFKSKASTLTLIENGKTIGATSLVTDYDHKQQCAVVEIVNYNIGGQDVPMPVSESNDVELDEGEVNQETFNAYAQKLLSEHDIVFEDYFTNERKEYHVGVGSKDLTKDIFAADMTGIHLTKAGEYVGHICFVADFKDDGPTEGRIFFDYAQAVNNTKGCEHLLPTAL